MRGEKVIVRSYGGKPLIRKIWEVQEGAILLIEDSQFQLLMNNDIQAVGPIGFPKEDVFKYDPKIANSIDVFSHGEFDWGKLRNWEDAQ